jgi:uncharacterized Rmd1/YagE family protein
MPPKDQDSLVLNDSSVGVKIPNRKLSSMVTKSSVISYYERKTNCTPHIAKVYTIHLVRRGSSHLSPRDYTVCIF